MVREIPGHGPPITYNLCLDLARFGRAMAKVALNFVCYRLGTDTALLPTFDRLRAFAREGTGDLWTFVKPSLLTGMDNTAAGPFTTGHEHVLVLMRAMKDAAPYEAVIVIISGRVIGNVSLQPVGAPAAGLPEGTWLISRCDPVQHRWDDFRMPDDTYRAIVNPATLKLEPEWKAVGRAQGGLTPGLGLTSPPRATLMSFGGSQARALVVAENCATPPRSSRRRHDPVRGGQFGEVGSSLAHRAEGGDGWASRRAALARGLRVTLAVPEGLGSDGHSRGRRRRSLSVPPRSILGVQVATARLARDLPPSWNSMNPARIDLVVQYALLEAGRQDDFSIASWDRSASSSTSTSADFAPRRASRRGDLHWRSVEVLPLRSVGVGGPRPHPSGARGDRR